METPREFIITTTKKAPPAKPFTVLVLGDCGVGKTSLVARYTTGQCPQSCLPTVEAATTEVESLGPVMIVDTSGHPRYRASLARRYFANADAALLVYDVANRATFDSLDARLMELQLLARPGIEVAVVGNKADPRGGRVDPAVSSAEAKLWAEQRCLTHWTVSARSSSQSAESVFVRLIRGGMLAESPRWKAKNSKLAASSIISSSSSSSNSIVGCCCSSLPLPPTRRRLFGRMFWRLLLLRRKNSVAPAEAA